MDELQSALTLEQIEVNLFRGVTPTPERNFFRIFGGQVIAQALVAAYRTVEGRACHSLQSYFIRPGDPKQPVLFQVERSRDGKTFATRRVIAIQKGEQIFNMACSFQVSEDGFDHQSTMPDAPKPETVEQEYVRAQKMFADKPEVAKHFRELAIDLRPVEPVDLRSPEPMSDVHRVWMRARVDVGNDAIMNQALLAYSSDFSLLGSAMRPHGVTWLSGVQTASLDHIVWFHRPTNFSRWHLYVQDSPSASGARGFNRGSLYREDGELVASTAQEGLIRKR